MKPEIFGVLSFVVCWALAAVVGITLGTRMAWRAGLPRRRSLLAVCATAVVILLGSKLLYLTEHVVLPSEDPNPAAQDTIAGLIWRGFRIPGGVLLIVPMLPLICRSLRLPTLRVADAIIPAVGLATFFVRVGCLLNGCCFGSVTDFPVAMTFPPEARVFGWQVSEGLIPAGAAHTLPVHPLQIYFALLGLALYFLGQRWQETKRYDGQVWTRFNLAFFGGTFLLELLRPHPLRINLVLTTTLVIANGWLALRARTEPLAVAGAH